MTQIIECVPNFSEGQDPIVLDFIVRAAQAVPGVTLLDHEMDQDHNRAVVTLIGDRSNIGEAAFRAVAEAAKRIDLTTHTGEHPRMGATDVLPFVPVKDATMDDCIVLAKEVGKRIGEELEIPVFLYEHAATREDRRNLPNVRRGQFEGLRDQIGTNPDKTPDFGPNHIHPTAGAMAVGARPFLIAYNVNLESDDIATAKAIGKAVRESSGGFKSVKGMGFMIEELGIAQVSMNLTDYKTTGMQTVFDEITRQAAEAGIQIRESEVVGLLPEEALPENYRESLKLERFSEDQIIENKLRQLGG